MRLLLGGRGRSCEECHVHVMFVLKNKIGLEYRNIDVGNETGYNRTKLQEYMS
jgi:hypothetical protein